MTRGVRNHSNRAARALALLVAGVLVAGTLAITAAAAGAAEPLAKLKITADNVQVKQKGKKDFKDAKDGMALKQGDTIKTDSTGRAEIDYSDGSLTRLAGSTIFTLSKLTTNKGGRQTQGTLSVGETWNRAAKVSETGSFEVKAGGTTAAVEGTAFVAKCVPNTSTTTSSSTTTAPTTEPTTGVPHTVTCTFTAVVDNIHVGSDVWDVTNVTDNP